MIHLIYVKEEYSGNNV